MAGFALHPAPIASALTEFRNSYNPDKYGKLLGQLIQIERIPYLLLSSNFEIET